METPIYVAKKSAWQAITPLKILFLILCFWLIIPIIIIIAGIISAKCQRFEFYNDKIIVKKGVISKNESRFAFSGVVGVSIRQSAWGRIFNYGDIVVDIIGRNWDINTTCITKPNQLKAFLETRIIQAQSMQNILVN